MNPFTPERLVDVSLFVTERDVETITATLMREASLHLNVQESEHWTPAPKWADLSETYRALLGRIDKVAHALGREGEGDGTYADPRPMRDRPALESDVLRLETRVAGWRDDLEAIERRVRDLEAAERQLALLAPLGVPVDELRSLRHHYVTIGSLPSENVARVAAALFQVSFVLLPLERGLERTLVAAAVADEDGHVLDRALRSAFFEPVHLPSEANGTPKEALAAVEAIRREAEAERDALRTAGDALVTEVGDLLTETRRALHANLAVCDVIRRFPFRDGVYVIGGYLPAARLDETEKKLRDVAEGQLVLEALPPTSGGVGGEVPSLVHNPRWLRPFEILVDTYGVTGYDELNPTLLAALVFTFMFGLMFGDMGHGAILAAIGLLLAWRGLSAGIVLAAAGGASIAFGAAYGMAFGYAVFDAPWLQPLHAIFELLIASVIAGVVILNLGMILNLISARRAGDTLRFWLDKSGVLGLAFYWTLVGGGLLVFQGLIPTPVWLLVLLPLALLTMFREPLEERLRGQPAHWTGNLVGGFFELFETVIGYASNSLSFVRMGAFAVAHEGLSHMVLSYSGGGTGWIVFLFGTLLIVGFEGLIVGIQALRLSYYEFFGRFFGGRGTPFRPLSFSGGSDV